MAIEIGVWRIDGELTAIEAVPLDLESRLEALLAQDISIAAPNWMAIGRQVLTAYDKLIDLLVIDAEGNLVVLELKRDKTYRDIIAQVLDYGSWVRQLRDEDIAKIYAAYRNKYCSAEPDKSLDDAFCERFHVKQMPDELNSTHELVIVASYLDQSTERIVDYLAEEHNVQINAVFFRVFRDGDREYLTRAWFKEPSIAAGGGEDEHPSKGEWNGEYYASYGSERSWDEAVKYGFISAGGGTWYSQTLSMLEPGDRIWVNIPGTGYVGVGKVTEPMVPVEDFMVSNNDQKTVPIVSLPLQVASSTRASDDHEKAEYLVRVEWIKTVPISKAIKEKGLFGNQNSVARPRTPKWDYTIERLKRRFGLE